MVPSKDYRPVILPLGLLRILPILEKKEIYPTQPLMGHLLEFLLVWEVYLVLHHAIPGEEFGKSVV